MMSLQQFSTATEGNDPKLETSEVVYNWLNLVTDFTFTIGLITIVVWFVIYRNGSDWPCNLKVQIALLFAMIVSFDIKDIWVVINVTKYLEVYN